MSIFLQGQTSVGPRHEVGSQYLDAGIIVPKSRKLTRLDADMWAPGSKKLTQVDAGM